MATIQSLGIGSGLLTNELVDNIIAAEREGSDLRLERREAKVDAQITAYGEVKSVISNLQRASAALADVNTLRETQANSSNDNVLTATTNQLAEVGRYRINVDSVAESQTVASQRFNAPTDTIGTGSLTFDFGEFEFDADDNLTGFTQSDDGNSFTLDLTSGNNTLSGVRDAINRLDAGIQASLVNDGEGYRLLFSSTDTGAANGFSVTATGDAGLQGLAFNAAQNDPDTNMLLTQRAQDANVSVNGLQITSASNELTEVARGVTIDLKDASNGSTVNLNITRDPSTMVERTEAFIDAYNEYKDLYDELTGFNPDNDQGGLLIGDSALRQVETQVRRSLTQLVEGLENSTYRTLADIGIFTDRNDDFKLALDSNKLTQAFQSSIDDVTGLFATQATASDALINYITKGADTEPGDYPINITQLATQGKFEGGSISGFADFGEVVISGSNDNFRINVDGTPADVTLTQGTYTDPDQLALMIQNSINNTQALQDRSRSVTVGFDPVSQSMEITSSRFGSQSQVFFENTDPTVSNSLGFTVPGQGSISGENFTNLGPAAFSATTLPTDQEVFADDSFDFAGNTASFNLTVGGAGAADGTYGITLDEDLSSVVDTEGNVTEARDRDDMLSYINAELNAAGLSGVVTASFNASNRLQFSTDPAAGSQTLALSDVAITGNDVLGLTGAQGTGVSGVSIDEGADFQIGLANRYGSAESDPVTVPAGTYETQEDLAAAIKLAIDSDPNVAALRSGAKTLPGTRPIDTAIDFTNRASGFEFALNGQAVAVDVTANGTDNLDSIQQAIDTALVGAGLAAGDVVAKMEARGLVLETAAQGSAQSLAILSDGRGDVTTNTGVALTEGGELDFATNPAAFQLRMDGVDIDVSLTDNLSGLTLDEQVAAIQTQLDQGLITAGDGGQFTAGDIKAGLNAANELVFESQSKNGQKTSATFGALASLAVTASDANAETMLGIQAQAANVAGRDAFGMEKGVYTGFDATSTVTYEVDDKGRGGFSIAFDNETRVGFTAVSDIAKAQLGFALPGGSENEVVTGKDVEGTINGIKANGRGQVLVAGSGSEAATNGYLLGSPGFDWSTAVALDENSNAFSVSVDGISSGEIRLDETVYANGASLANEMTRKINADANLAGDFKQVEVQFDADTNTFGIFSASTGEESTVRLNSINGTLSSITGLTTNSETVDGKAASGEPDPARGLQVRVLGGETGERGTVNYIQGVFDQLDGLFRNMLSSRGTITTRMDRLDLQMESIANDRQRLDERISAQEARLKAQFSFNDQIISQLNSTESFLSQQFEIMNGMLANKK